MTDKNDKNDNVRNNEIQKQKAFLKKIKYPKIDLKDFDYKAFATDLAEQASEVIPSDINQQDKEFIVNIIARFSALAGESLVQEEDPVLNVDGVCIVIQFIGEWIFHKSIDIIRGGVDSKYREGVLQKIAFTIFEVTKKGVEKDLTSEQLINLVEEHVEKSFKKAIEALVANGKISSQIADNVFCQSNIDKMAEDEAKENNAKKLQKLTREESLLYVESKIVSGINQAQYLYLAEFPEEKLEESLAMLYELSVSKLSEFLKKNLQVDVSDLEIHAFNMHWEIHRIFSACLRVNVSEEFCKNLLEEAINIFNDCAKQCLKDNKELVINNEYNQEVFDCYHGKLSEKLKELLKNKTIDRKQFNTILFTTISDFEIKKSIMEDIEFMKGISLLKDKSYILMIIAYLSLILFVVVSHFLKSGAVH